MLDHFTSMSIFTVRFYGSLFSSSKHGMHSLLHQDTEVATIFPVTHAGQPAVIGGPLPLPHLLLYSTIPIWSQLSMILLPTLT